MIEESGLSHLKKVYMYEPSGELIYCDIMKIGRGWGYFKEGDTENLNYLSKDDLEKMYYTREEAERFDLFSEEGIV